MTVLCMDAEPRRCGWLHCLSQRSTPSRSCPFDRVVEQYAVTGGVPKYLEFFQDDRDLLDQLKDVVLSKNGFLYEEPNFLLKSESMTGR